MSRNIFLAALLFGLMVLPISQVSAAVPYLERWSIYELDVKTQDVTLLYTTPWRITVLRFDWAGERFVFAQRIGGEDMELDEICTVGLDGSGLTRLTENDRIDTYPTWSPDGEKVAFLTWGETLDIHVIDSDGGGERLLYDSGYHDADVHWVGGKITFTRNNGIWIMNEDGTGTTQVTEHPQAGEWGSAPLPYGDYDPRLSPDGGTIVFERMTDNAATHGEYDLYLVNVDGTGLVALTDNGWTQGMASWSPSGDRLVYVVSAVGSEGRYDVFMIDADGGGMVDLTSEVFPAGFLTHDPIFGPDGSKVYFVGEWWDWKVLPSSISCVAAPNEVQLGGEVTASGSITPAVAGAAVTLTYTSDAGFTREVISDLDGKYSDVYVPSDTGPWTVEASWQGDAGHVASESSPVEFTVIEAGAEGEGAAPSGGIPGFPLGSIILGLVLSMSLLYVIGRNQGVR